MPGSQWRRSASVFFLKKLITDERMTTVRKAIAISFAQTYTSMVLRVASTIILARLLTPEEIGTFSVVVVLVNLAHILRAFGVGQYLIQEKELTRDRMRAAFGVSLFIACTIAGVLFVISAPVAKFYGVPGMQRVMLVLSCNFLLIPFSSIIVSLHRRDLNFRPISYIYVSEAVVQASISMILAGLGFGYMSLAWGSLAGTITTVLVANLNRPKNLPFLPGIRGFRRVLSFGSQVSFAKSVQEIGTGAPEIVIGRVINMGAVGLFSRASGLIQLFDRLITSSIMPVVVPHFSRRQRMGHQVKESYLRAVAYLTGLAWPFYGFLGLMAFPIIRILYGSQWDAAVPVVEILSIFGFLEALFSLAGQLFIALGEVTRNMQYRFVSMALKVLFVVVAVPFGLQAVALGIVMGSLFGLFISYRFLNTIIGFGVNDFISCASKSFQVFICSAIGPLAVRLLMEIGPDNFVIPCLIASLTWLFGWITGMVLIGHPLKDELVPIWAKLTKKLNFLRA